MDLSVSAVFQQDSCSDWMGETGFKKNEPFVGTVA